ncbi:hypothetical protein [Microcoleus sp. FACHB-672]|uniref:hypothetical protein n=1 Tax=Microcoleus sp. FACHB-672 TaxID=2692825 RepID=UPI0016880628|nr:hypothetical protein [Microcoleus sp. FACHB-672]MBD2039448.1 hypothetical protein [Microcoleus sp. FACHB-672]
MPSQDSTTQVTFHYVHGQSESFSITKTPQEFYQQLQIASEQNWITLHLSDQSVVIRLDKVAKVEVKPPFPEIAGDGVFPDAKRVTALTRGAAR